MDKITKEWCYKKIDEIFNDKKANEVFKKQCDIYFDIKNSNINNNHNYKIGDNVKLSKGMFMRGEGALITLDEEKLKYIKEYGFISPDITIKYNPKQKTPLCIPVWNIQKDMLLSEYIELYSGATFMYTKKEDNYKHHTCLVPYKKLEDKIESFRKEDYWLWSCEQTKETRFMPSLSRDDEKIQIGFIINTKGAEELIKNDIFNLDFDKDVLEKFIPDFFIKDFIYGERDDFTTNRESAIIFGIPSNFIEGILVGRIYEKNNKKLDLIKDIFPDCYICNLDGKVIL